ncbi:CoA-transferase family III domain-containing protein [Colletotrichum navitas]|uniref:CoA-transferase family III domain-containing protein n=1 Tax=Colletotrichum navitas TaxID=681940 RepID=A0AAD8PJ85_9PEZI|nr:CoA-transferase family III domain-containing protein [Colletotrichum navitas]KAK1564045.1 CoA-transferase family III domain-containing protein [Colletotrichum navitas]
MASDKIPNVYGPGTFTDKTFTLVSEDTQRIFRLIIGQTSGFTQDECLLSKVKFTGEEYPVIPGPIKTVSVAASLHAMTGVLADEILAIRGVKNDKRQITVNTTHTAIWFGCIATAFLDGVDVISLTRQGKLKGLLPDWEQGWTDTALKYRTTGLYPTNNPDVWYSLHGSMNAEPVLRSIGVDPLTLIKSNDEAAAHIARHTIRLSPEKMEMTNLLNGLCGSIYQTVPTPPVAFPSLNPNDKRPLSGVKVIEMIRVIADPEFGTILVAYGKRTIAIDLRNKKDEGLLKSLVSECDVFIQGFRLNKMPKFGLGLDDLLKMAGERGRGIVHVSENCYGPDGYYAERPGWQQIADAASGSAYAVLPSLPISDMSTGVLGAVGAMLGLKRRAVEGGSYYSHASLTGVNAYALTEGVGLYLQSVVDDCKKRFQWGEMRGAHHVLDLLVTVWNGWKQVLSDYLDPEGEWFRSFNGSSFDNKTLTILRPVDRFEGESESTPHWKTPSVPYAHEKAESVRFM